MAINNVDTTKYIDVSYSGNSFSTFFDQTNTLILKGTGAIKNVMKLYLMSQIGDYGRNVTKGGPMMKVIGKPLTDDYGKTIQKTITDALSIYSNIVLTQVKATPDRENKRWKVSVAFIDTYNKVQDSFSIGIPASG